jgi:hypothetical protein
MSGLRFDLPAPGVCKASRMADATADSSSEVPSWVQELGITDRSTGLQRARASWSTLIKAGARVLGSGQEYTIGHLVFSGFLARAQGLHEAAVAAISGDNPYAAFTLLRAYAENAAAVLYTTDHSAELEKFWRDTGGRGVGIGKITNYAASRFGGFKGIYSDLSKHAHPHALSLLASNRVIDGHVVHWSSAPAFRSDSQAAAPAESQAFFSLRRACVGSSCWHPS